MVCPPNRDDSPHHEVLRRIRLSEDGHIQEILDRAGRRTMFQRDPEAHFTRADQIRMFACLGLDPQQLEHLSRELMAARVRRPSRECLAFLGTIAGCLSVTRQLRAEIEQFLLALLQRDSLSLSVRSELVRHLAGLPHINCDVASWVLRYYQQHGNNLSDAFAVQYFVDRQADALKRLPSFEAFRMGLSSVPSVCTSYMLGLLGS